MKRLVSDLAKIDSFFAEASLHPTGSIYANVKVGLPHEADYLLVVPEDKTLKTGNAFQEHTLYEIAVTVLEHKLSNLIEGLPHWVIHGIKQHRITGGICLIVQCPSNETCENCETVGVTVDLVPVYVFKSTNESLRDKANAFLPFNLQQYAERGQLYRLTTNTECDTGLIENQIMKELPENKKRVFRVLKFLNQNVHSHESNIDIDGTTDLDKATCLQLYGYKPRVSSYRLRLLFLHLLQGVHDTKAEKKLTDSRLLLCLIDVWTNFDCFNSHMIHPFIKSAHTIGWFHIGYFENLATYKQRLFATMRSDSGQVSLLNYGERDGLSSTRDMLSLKGQTEVPTSSHMDI